MSQGKREHEEEEESSSQQGASLEVSKKRKHNAVVPEPDHHHNHHHYGSKNLYKSPDFASRSSSSQSAYTEKQITLHLTIAPIDASDPLAGVERQLDDSLLTYIREAGGILMGWSNPRFSRPEARICDESPFSSCHVTVSTLVWRPRQGEVVTGRVKLMGPSHIGLLILDTFNASIPLTQIPETWRYEENFEDQDGAWRDGDGKVLEIDEELKFETVDVKKGANILSVEGSLLRMQDEKETQTSTKQAAAEESESNKAKEPKEPKVAEEAKSSKEVELSKAERKARRKSEKQALKAAKKSKDK